MLAIEPRLFLPKDIDSGSLCYAHLELIYLDTPYYTNQKATVFAPCLLPHLNVLKEVSPKTIFPTLKRSGIRNDSPGFIDFCQILPTYVPQAMSVQCDYSFFCLVGESQG